MKKIFFIAVLLNIGISLQLKAQVKKAVKTPVVTQVKPKIDVYKTNADDAVQILSDELRKLKVVLTGMEDNPLYKFNPNNEKIPDATESEKILYFGDGANARIKASVDGIVDKVSFSTNNEKYYTAIKTLLSFEKRTKIAEGYNDTTFKDKYVFGNLSSTEFLNKDKPITVYSITLERGYTNFPDSTGVFDINNIDIHAMRWDNTYPALNFVKQLGYSFYYSTPDLHVVDEKSGKRVSTLYTAYFSKNVEVDFTLNKLWLVSGITFKSPDPIAFNKLKKAFNLSTWTFNGTADGNIGLYSNKNVRCEVRNNAQMIVFNIKPVVSDIETRFALIPTPNLSDLVKLRYSGSEKIVEAYIKARYLTELKYDDKLKKYVFDEKGEPFIFYYPSPTGKLVRALFKMVLTPDWTAPFLINTDDQEYLQSLSAEFDNSGYNEDNTKVLINGQFRIHSKDWEETRKQNDTKQKEDDRLAEIEKERKRAENAAKVNEAIINGTENLKRILRKQ